MDDQTTRGRLEAFERFCRDRGLPLTAQRRAILTTVLDLDDHPTADQVYEAVSRRIPGISRATVYRTLETLVRSGAIAKASHPGRSTRYDRRTEIHHHLICLRCEAVIDISDERLDAIRLPDTSDVDFEVTDHRVQLRGICRSCREKEEES